MKKIIGRKEYDTETATLIKRYACGHFGDPTGFEEILYQTPDGFYFIYVNGGSQSDHPEEGICRLSKSKAEEWLEQHK